MTCEKTYLFGEDYPKLKEHCREKYGMEFQVRQSYLLQSAINFYQKLAISIDKHLVIILKMHISYLPKCRLFAPNKVATIGFKKSGMPY